MVKVVEFRRGELGFKLEREKASMNFKAEEGGVKNENKEYTQVEVESKI
jgi:hypothetical protein